MADIRVLHKGYAPLNVITDIDAFNKTFEESIKEGVKNTTKIMLNDVREYVWREIYQNNSLRKQNPKTNNRYVRTYEFYKAITMENTSSIINGKRAYSGRVFIDINKMRQSSDYGLGQHEGWKSGNGDEEDDGGFPIQHWYGKDIRAWLVSWIEDGKEDGFIKNLNSKFSTGIKVFKNTQDRMMDKYSKSISRYVSRQTRTGVTQVETGTGGVFTKMITKAKPRLK